MFLKSNNIFFSESRLIYVRNPDDLKKLNQSSGEGLQEKAREELLKKIQNITVTVIEEKFVQIFQSGNGEVENLFLDKQNEPTNLTLRLVGDTAVEVRGQIKTIYPEVAELEAFLSNESSIALLREYIIKTFIGHILRKKIEILQEQGGYDALMEGFLYTKTMIGREQFDIQANEILRKIAEKDGNASLLFLDVDDFKQINDRYEHAVGDMALVHLGEKIKEAMREQKGDICARHGGDEILILLNDCDDKKASIAAERIRKNIEENPVYLIHKEVIDEKGRTKGYPQFINPKRYEYLIDSNEVIEREEGRGLKVIIHDPRDTSNEKATVILLKIPLTVSIGVAQCPDLKHGAFDRAREIADKQMYLAKAGTDGRNQTFCNGEHVGS